MYICINKQINITNIIKKAMKATSKYNKSEVMKRAWTIFKGNTPYSYSFSAALRRAWEVEKANAEYMERKARMAAFVTPSTHWSGCGTSEYYNNARNGQYMGD